MKLLLAVFTALLFSAVSRSQDSEPAKTLSRYITYPSIEYREKPAGMFLLKKCREKGLFITVLTGADTAFNFVASLYPLEKNKPNIIFLNHIDVVGITDSSLWKHDPFSGKISGDTIWGRGAIDNKGMAIAQLFALAAFKESCKDPDLPYNVSILAVSGEETGGIRGAEIVCGEFLHILNPYFILGEGGSGVRGILSSDPDKQVFGTSTMEKSRLIIKLELELHSSGHGSVPPPEYATKEMIMALENLLSSKRKILFSRVTENSLRVLGIHESGSRGFLFRNNRFFLFRPVLKMGIKKDPLLLSLFQNTITLTKIELPAAALNQLSSGISATLDCRLLPETDPDDFVRSVKKKLKDKRISATILSAEYSNGRSLIPEFYTALCQSLSATYPHALNLEIIFPATTDNHRFRGKGIPVYGLFPVVFSEEQLKSIHNHNEYITRSQLEKAIQVYSDFLEKTAVGP